MAFGLATISDIAGLLTARHAGGSLVIGGIDLLGSLESQSVLSFAYADNTSDKADDLSIEIADPARTWMQTYLPKKGIECKATIKVFNWLTLGDTREFDCGAFWLDQIDFSGPPNIVSVRATSIPVTTGIKTQKKYRFWEGQDLKAIANQIASENQLTLVWDTQDNPTIKRTDQVETADLEYLRDRAKDAALSLKIFNKQLIIYSEKEYEQKAAVYTLTYGMSNILSYSFSSKLNETYKKSKNAYVSPETGKLIESEFEPEEVPEGSGSDLMNNERSEEEETEGAGEGGALRSPKAVLGAIDYTNTDAGAEGASAKKTKAKLREKNKHEKECSITVVGNPSYLSGLNMDLSGFGIFDGKWFISGTTHSISGNGYVTELNMRMALKGY